NADVPQSVTTVAIAANCHPNLLLLFTLTLLGFWTTAVLFAIGAPTLVTDLKHRFHFDRNVVRQRRDTNRHPRVTTRFAEDVDEQIGRAVDNLRVREKV